MPLQRLRKCVRFIAEACTSFTLAAIKNAAALIFEPTYRVRGQIKVSCDTVRVNVNAPITRNTEEGSMSNEELSQLAGQKGVPGKMRGAKPSARYKLAAAQPFVPVGAPPAQFAMVPPVLHMFGNDAYGDCVSAEEGFAKLCGSPPVDVGDQVVIQWASRHGVLNGADLADVLDMMLTNGFAVGPTVYDDGGKQSVDYSNEPLLQAAIAAGPVKIAIDADALPSGAGDYSGWHATGGRRWPNTDHCVSLCGYGPAGWLYQQLGVSLPAQLSPTTMGYLLYTWATIGFVDHAWLMGTCTEAWVRNPTTVVVGPTPTPPPPPPPVPPTPTPTPTPAQVGQLVLTQTLQPGTYPIGPGLALVVGQPSAIPWALVLQIIIAILNGLVPVVPPMPPTPPGKGDVKLVPVM